MNHEEVIKDFKSNRYIFFSFSEVGALVRRIEELETNQWNCQLCGEPVALLGKLGDKRVCEVCWSEAA